MIEAVVFDMDGVLFDTERLSAIAWRQVGEEMGVLRIGELIIGSMGINDHDTRLYFLEELGPAFPYEEFRRRTGETFWKNLGRDGLPNMKGLYEIMEYLEGTGLPVVLATSSRRESAQDHLAEAGITKYFKEVITGDCFEHSKPDPEIYLTACRAIGVAPENAVAVEDSPNGLKSARAAGMQVVMIPDQIPDSPALAPYHDRVCSSLLELREVLKAALQEQTPTVK